MHPYYQDKQATLRRIFGPEATVLGNRLEVGERVYPIINDVIVTLSADRMPGQRPGLSGNPVRNTIASRYDPAIQGTFGREWQQFPEFLDEYKNEVLRYFDLLPEGTMKGANIVDLGCGIGRWANYVADHCTSITLVDFSDSIYVARQNMLHRANAIFVMGDVLDLPFANDAFDLGYCLGVLHHLPVDALKALRDLRAIAPTWLVYIYYKLDNRPQYFRILLHLVTLVRRLLCKVKSAVPRSIITWMIAILVYRPLCIIDTVAQRFRTTHSIPLAEGYKNASLRRIRQDVYDRFFTSIEQRFTRAEILELRDSFRTVTVSERIPYWHFLCESG